MADAGALFQKPGDGDDVDGGNGGFKQSASDRSAQDVVCEPERSAHEKHEAHPHAAHEKHGQGCETRPDDGKPSGGAFGKNEAESDIDNDDERGKIRRARFQRQVRTDAGKQR